MIDSKIWSGMECKKRKRTGTEGGGCCLSALQPYGLASSTNHMRLARSAAIFALFVHQGRSACSFIKPLLFELTMF